MASANGKILYVIFFLNLSSLGGDISRDKFCSLPGTTGYSKYLQILSQETSVKKREA